MIVPHDKDGSLLCRQLLKGSLYIALNVGRFCLFLRVGLCRFIDINLGPLVLPTIALAQKILVVLFSALRVNIGIHHHAVKPCSQF